MQLERQVGRHIVRAEGVVIFVRNVGYYSEGEAKQVTAVMDEILDRFNSAYLLVELAQLGDVEPAARKAVTEWFRDKSFKAIILCGAGFPTRVVGRMVSAAVRVMRGIDLPFVFASSEKEGRAWIAERRRGK